MCRGGKMKIPWSLIRISMDGHANVFTYVYIYQLVHGKDRERILVPMIPTGTCVALKVPFSFLLGEPRACEMDNNHHSRCQGHK